MNTTITFIPGINFREAYVHASSGGKVDLDPELKGKLELELKTLNDDIKAIRTKVLNDVSNLKEFDSKKINSGDDILKLNDLNSRRKSLISRMDKIGTYLDAINAAYITNNPVAFKAHVEGLNES